VRPATTGHHAANFRHNPLGAVLVRTEDGRYFLRALTQQALFAAINEATSRVCVWLSAALVVMSSLTRRGRTR